MRRQTSHASTFRCDMSMVRWEKEEKEEKSSGLLVHALKPGQLLQVRPHNPSSPALDFPLKLAQNSIPDIDQRNPLNRRSQELNIFGVRASQCQQLKHVREAEVGDTKRSVSPVNTPKKKLLNRHKSQVSRHSVEASPRIQPSFLVKGQGSRSQLQTADRVAGYRTRRG